LKQALLILIFCISRLTAQVNPPDLRCLEVIPNGNVKLSWIPSSDPGNQFFEYEVYFSISKTGPFALVSSGLNAINTSTCIHATSASTSQTCYYYMLAKYGTGGGSSSQHSDTLQTIFITAYPNTTNGTQDIKFNPVHTPKLPSTVSTFTLNKEYPLGTWNQLSIQTETVYPDTITVCLAKMNYQAFLFDGSGGCTSGSNLLVAEYANSKDPERPYVDSISVLPNGNTVLAWQIPIDKDIDKYIIQYLVGATNQTIDIVPGRNNTFYTYTTTAANSTAVGLFVQAQDSCKRNSTVNYQIRTMFLRASYDTCAYQTTLNWTKYVWADIKGVPVETLGKYKIYYSVNGSAFSLVGETTDTSFVHPGVAPGKNICYFIRVVNARNTITASSNRSCFFSDQVVAAQFIYLKTATIIDNSSAEVRVYLDNSRGSTGIAVHRSENGTDFKNVGFIPYTGAAHYSFIDNAIDSRLKSYTYRTFVIDICGKRRDSSNIAKTILLKVHEDAEQIFTKHLSWTEYKGFGGDVSGYNIYRVINGDISTALIGSTDALTTTYTDNLEGAAAQGAKIEYLVQAVEGIGNPYGIFETSSSNPVPVYMEGNIYVPNAFAPSGVNKTWLPITHFIEKTDYHVSVFNRWGKRVFETSDDTKAWDGNDCIADIYVYLIDYKNARGEYLQVKGNVLLLR